MDYWIYIGLFALSTTYSYSWDIYMDWGLMRNFSRNKWGLRNKLLYSKWFYYFAAVTNLLMRLMWIVP